MKSLWFLILAFLLPIAACQEQGEQAGTTEETPAVDAAAVEQSIHDEADRFEQAMLAGDQATLMSVYAEGAISMPPGMPRVEGIEAIRAEYEQMLSVGAPTAFSLDPQTIVVSESGDVAYEVGSYTWTGPTPAGSVTETGKYVNIWKPAADGTWKLAVDIWNTDAMPGAPSETTTETTAGK